MRVRPRRARRTPRLGRMHAWVNGRLLDDPHGPAITVERPRDDGGRRGVRGGQGRRRAAVRADPSPRAGWPAPPPASGCRRSTRTTYAAASRPCSPREHLPLGRLRITYTGGVAPLGSGRGDSPPTLVVVADTLKPAAPTTSVVTVPWPRNERGALAGLKTTSYAENVVALAYAAGARRQRGGLRQPRRPSVRGHRVERLLRRRRRAAHADARGRLPGRDQPRPAPRVVRRPRGRRAGRGARRRPRRSSWSPRPATCRP